MIKFMVPDALRSSYLCLILLFHSTVVLDACLHGTRGTLYVLVIKCVTLQVLFHDFTAFVAFYSIEDAEITSC